MIVTISGFPASGTTTLSTQLKERLDASVTYVNGGDVFRQLAENRGMSLKEFSKYVNENPQIDKEIDANLRGVIREFQNENHGQESIVDLDSTADILILESRLAGWIAGTDATVRIWLKASAEIRKDRISDDKDKHYEIVERAHDERQRYEEWYNINLLDKSIYDLIIDTGCWNEKSVAESVEVFINNYDESSDARALEIVETNQFDHLLASN